MTARAQLQTAAVMAGQWGAMAGQRREALHAWAVRASTAWRPARGCCAEFDVVLLGEGSLARILGAGRTIIHPCSLEGPACGLIPLQRPAVSTTRGLRWNLGAPQLPTQQCGTAMWAQ